MKLGNLINFLSLLFACLLLFPEISIAATEYATFESFYRQSSNTLWIIVGAGVVAIIGGAFIFFTGGTASPAVASIGTWLGGLMGYSGVAATNAGLALLGGGSIASGGFGMIGGTALLAATFTFSTGVVLDYAAGKAVETYDYSNFVKNSKNMTTLPLPKNTSGPDSYEDAMDVLEDINKETPISTNQNQKIIFKAIKSITSSKQSELTPEESSRLSALLALLYFTNNDYKKAKHHSYKSYNLASNNEVKASLPAFIYGTSLLYDTKPEFSIASQYFNYAITNEPVNPLTPLLFAIFLDRMMYRFNDDNLSITALDKIYKISEPLPYDERKAIIQLGIISRYFILIKLQQQKILSLTQSNETIKDNPKTLATVQKALSEYKSLIKILNKIADINSTPLNNRLKRKPKFFDKLTGNGIKVWEMQWADKIKEMQKLRLSYFNQITALETLVEELEFYQAELERARLEEERLKRLQQDQKNLSTKNFPWWTYLSIIATLVLLTTYFFKIKRRV